MASGDEQIKYTRIQKRESKFNHEVALRRLPKRLAYVLRYGALKEGLKVDDNGYVELDRLCDISLFKDYTEAEVLQVIKTSVGYREVHRFNWQDKDGKVYVRAASYLRKLERNPFHPDTKVMTLFECTMTHILAHLDDYDLEDFPDEYIIRTMIHRLKRQKKMSVKALKILLVPALTHLDLDGIFLTKNALQAVWTQCPDLMAVSLRNCGYIITDSMLAQFTKNLPKLQKLNLCHCTHLTPKFLTVLSKNLPHLKVLHVVSVPSLTFDAVFNFIKSSNELQFLDVYYLKTKPEEFHILMEVAKKKGLQLVLREPKINTAEESVEEENEEEEIIDGWQNLNGEI